MKTILSILCIIIVTNVTAQSSKDMPSPTANNVTLTTGSYVIPMGNTLQVNASGFFNLKSYGLIIHLLNNNVKIKWVIKAGKSKDGIDFTVNAERLLPATSTGASRDFYAGPFVIQAADTTGVAALVSSFYTAHSLTGNDRPNVYKTTASVTVDIRHDLTGFKPKAAILNDGGNDTIHIKYMQIAGVTTANYTSALGVDLYTQCYTFASEPHAASFSVNNNTVRAIRSFVTYGGNFLAQCEAVETYENNTSHGHFHSTNGIEKTSGDIAASSTVYPNPDLPYSQFQGTTYLTQAGSIRVWKLATLSLTANNAAKHSTGGTILTQDPIGTGVSKLNASNKAGGLVFYMGNHSFSSANTVQTINGIRMYMNAFLTPVSLNLNCTIGSTMPYILSANTENFTAVNKNSNAQLEWTASEPSSIANFQVEKSSDGKNFTSITSVNAVDGKKVYTHTDPLYTNSNVVYYRIKVNHVDGKTEYSDVRALRISGAEMNMQVFPNPASTEIMVQLPASWTGKVLIIEIMDQSGRLVQKEAAKAFSNVQHISLSRLTPGTYYIRTICDEQTSMQRFLKR